MIVGPIVDAHHHLWDLRRFPYRWLARAAPARPFGDHTAIKRDYLPQDYSGDIADARVAGTVFVEANANAEDPADETAWVQEQSDTHGFPSAIVGHADLCDADLPRQLDRHARSARFRGVRAMLGWDEDPVWRFADRPYVSREPPFRDGIRRLAQAGLSLDLVVLPAQLDEVAQIAAVAPDLRIAINHLGMLRSGNAAMAATWERGIAAAARAPNVFIKLSGLWPIDRGWNPAALRGPVLHAIAQFGAGRCMYGSNLPVESVMCPARRQIESLRAVLDGLAQDQVDEIFAGTARRFYRLEA